jgi:hypothetical protein
VDGGGGAAVAAQAAVVGQQGGCGAWCTPRKLLVHRDLYHAAALLAEVAGDLPLRAATRPALHASLLRAAARLAGDPLDAVQEGDLELDSVVSSPRPGLEEDLWKAAEALEMLDHDGRLDAVAQLVGEAAVGGRACLITTDRVDEADYVASHLHTLGRTVAIVTGSTPRNERGSTVEQLASGGIVVGSQIVYDLLDQLPDGTLNVWWSPPWTLAEAEKRLGVGPMSEGVETVVILSEPPLPADRTVRTLVGLLQTDPPG